MGDLGMVWGLSWDDDGGQEGYGCDGLRDKYWWK